MAKRKTHKFYVVLCIILLFVPSYTTHIYICINKSYSVHARNSTSQLISHSHIFLSQIFLTCTCSSLYCIQIIGDFQREKICVCHTYCSMHLNIFVYYKVHIHPFLASFFIWTFKRQSKGKKIIEYISSNAHKSCSTYETTHHTW